MTQKEEERKSQKQIGTDGTEPSGTVWTNFRMPREVRRDLRIIAAERDKPFSDVCITALTEFVERNRK